MMTQNYPSEQNLNTEDNTEAILVISSKSTEMTHSHTYEQQWVTMNDKEQ